MWEKNAGSGSEHWGMIPPLRAGFHVPCHPISVSTLPLVARKQRKTKRLKRFLHTLACVPLSALAACSTTLPPTPQPPAQWRAAARLVPAQYAITLSDGSVLPVRVWRAQGPQKAILLALHGFNDSRDAWERPADFFVKHGITVMAPDQRGFGQAPRRSYWSGTARMVQDIREAITQIQQDTPNTPLYLAGESMGGAIAMVLMSQPDAPHVAGTLLLAPAVWRLGVEARLPLTLLNSLVPQNLVPEQSVPVHVVASDSKAALIRLYYDPLTLHATRWEALQGLVTLMRQAAAAAPLLQGRIFCAYGDKDQLVPPAAMAAVWQAMEHRRTQPPARQDLIVGGHHLLLRDQQGERVMQDMVSWMFDAGQWLPSGGDSAAGLWLADQLGHMHKGGSGLFFLLPAQLETFLSVN